MNYNIGVKKLQWEQQINNEYKRYQEFINNTNMPKYKINFVEKLKGVTYSMETLIYKRPILLNVNVGFMISGDKHCQPTLFHEFTHMWDSENLFTDKDFKLRKKVLSHYTEYHASQIGFLRFIESESINKVNRVSLEDSFNIFDEKYTISEYYEKKCSLLQESITNYLSDKSASNYVAIIDSYLYIFGVKNICDTYISELKMPEYECIFTEKMMQMYDFLKRNVVDERLWRALLSINDILDAIYIKDAVLNK